MNPSVNPNPPSRCIIGIDPSINSTGICVNINNESIFDYYIITSKLTKKQSQFTHPQIRLIKYEKNEAKDCEYSEKESIKTLNFHNIVSEIEKIVDKYHPNTVLIEGVSYGSVGSAALVDLAGLNYMIRQALLKKDIPFEIVSPTSNKKAFCGNGQATKDVMIDTWKRWDSNINNVNEIKIDDLADAFALSVYREN